MAAGGESQVAVGRGRDADTVVCAVQSGGYLSVNLRMAGVKRIGKPNAKGVERMSVNRNRLLRYAFGGGIGLWLIGYLLGIVLFAFVPAALIGWIITPIGVMITVWVLLRVKSESLWFYSILSVVWTLIAVILDFVFIVKAFNPSDGYYKVDVYLYYALTFLLPVTIGCWTSARLSASRTHAAAAPGGG